MTHLRLLIHIILACGIVFGVSACGSKQKDRSESPAVQDYTITCIGVLPAASGADPQQDLDADEEKSLRQGAEVMDRIIAGELSGRPDIRFVGRDHVSGLQVTGGESMLEMARLVGRSINCNAILENRVWRYSERIGGKFTAERPASVSFEMRLVGLDSGVVLWSAKYDEVQKSALENLYDWGKARSRGFTWVTAEELMKEGIRGRFASSPYFKPSKANDPGQSFPADDQI